MDSEHAESPMESDAASAPDEDAAYQTEDEYLDDEFGDDDSIEATEKQAIEMTEYIASIVQGVNNAGLAPHRNLSSRLCQHCARMTSQAMRTPDGYEHTPDVWTLLSSADECELCALLLETYGGQMLIEMERSDADPKPTREEAFEFFLSCEGINKGEAHAVRVRQLDGEICFEVKRPGDNEVWLAWTEIEKLEIFTDSGMSFLVYLPESKKADLPACCGSRKSAPGLSCSSIEARTRGETEPGSASSARREVDDAMPKQPP